MRLCRYSMTLLVLSFVAGALTVLAPCILPIIPVVVGSALSSRSWLTPWIVVGSLSLSIILFTLLLKASTLFITIPQGVWTSISGLILIFFGFTLLFPALWEKLPFVNSIATSSQKFAGDGYGRRSILGDVMIGAAFGPIFSTCSPTYFVILATVLPASFFVGIFYLLIYTLGLSLALLLIIFFGEKIMSGLMTASDNRGYLKRGFGIICIILGLAIASGYDKKFETALLDAGVFNITAFEQNLLDTYK